MTIASTGNASDFGDMSVTRFATQSCSNSIRGVSFAGGVSPGGKGKVIDFTTMATLGNSVNFGEIDADNSYPLGAMASPVRGVLGGGYLSPSGNTNVIQYVQIMTQGDAVDFGDLTAAKGEASGCSNGHGGLG